MFTRYLVGRDPDDYVQRCYRDGHGRIRSGGDALDAALLRSATGGPVRAQVADAYARIFRPRGALRRKLILLLAILENTPPTHRTLTAGSDGRWVSAALRIAGALAVFGLALGAGFFRFGARHLASGPGAARA